MTWIASSGEPAACKHILQDLFHRSLGRFVQLIYPLNVSCLRAIRRQKADFMQWALLVGQGNGMMAYMALMQAVLGNSAVTKCCTVAGQRQMATHICSRSPRPMALLQRHLSCSICRGTSQQLRGRL